MKTGVIAIGVFLAAALYLNSLAKELALRKDLFTLRTAIDEYRYDKHKRPRSFQELISAGYLSELPAGATARAASLWLVTADD